MRRPLWHHAIGGALPATPILFLHGAFSNARDWPASIARSLPENPLLFVDQRDAGRNLWTPDANYTLADMADDVAHFMMVQRVHRAHIVGASMGGCVAQQFALDHPTRVASLSLVMTTPGSGVWDAGLAPPSTEGWEAMRAEYAAHLGGRSWAALVGRYVRGGSPIDEAERRARRVLAHGLHTNAGHGRAMASSVGRVGRLAQICAPTLIVHGRRDAVFPLSHALLMRDAIPGCALKVVDASHHISEDVGAEIGSVVREHVRRSEATGGGR